MNATRLPADRRGEHGPLEFRRSRLKTAVRVSLGLMLVAMSYAMATWGDDLIDRAIGWVGTAFFGAATLVGLTHVIRGGTVFSFDSAGITDHGNSLVISWSEIQECDVVSFHGTTFLAITFRAPEQFLGRIGPTKRVLAWLDERMGCGQWALSFAGVSPGIDAALEFVRDRAVTKAFDLSR